MKQTTVLLLLCALMAAACSRFEQPKTVELNRWYVMYDEDGRRAGTVLLRPVGEGEIRDVSNRLIGVVAAPPK